MSGIRTETRLVSLERLQRRTAHEIARAVRTGDTDEVPRLRLLQARIEQEVVLEAARVVVIAPTVGPPPRADHVGDHLLSLGVTAHDVKEWAVTQGLLDKVRRGRIRADLVEAYANATQGRARAITAHGCGDCSVCGDSMIKSPTWINHPETRDQWTGLGLVRQGARGLCSRCYVRLRNHGTLDQIAPPRELRGAEKCGRCGIAGIAAELCIDCEEFLAHDDDPTSRKATA